MSKALRVGGLYQRRLSTLPDFFEAMDAVAYLRIHRNFVQRIHASDIFLVLSHIIECPGVASNVPSSNYQILMLKDYNRGVLCLAEDDVKDWEELKE